LEISVELWKLNVQIAAGSQPMVAVAQLSTVREWRFRNSFNLAINSLPVLHFDTLIAYPSPEGLNTQGMMVFFPCQTPCISLN
jgi:hypothetical protein